MSQNQPEQRVVREWFEPGLSVTDGELVTLHWALLEDGTLWRREQRWKRRKPYWTSWQRYMFPEVPDAPDYPPPPVLPPGEDS